MSKPIDYHKTIGNELMEVKNRVRNLLCESTHWLSDGRHKESILKSVLERHLPQNISTSNGFIRFPESYTTEIDVLLYDNSFPVLFKTSDVVFVTPNTVFGGVEVKSNIKSDQLEEVLLKIAKISEQVSEKNNIYRWETFNSYGEVRNRKDPWFSLFCYESSASEKKIMNLLNKVAEGNVSRAIRCICLGPNKFIRFWEGKKDHPYSNESFTGWRLYELKRLAFSYFMSNMIWQDSTPTSDQSPWFALDNKEVRLKLSQKLTR